MDNMVPIGYQRPPMAFIVVCAPDYDNRVNLDDSGRKKVRFLASQLKSVLFTLTERNWRVAHIVGTSDAIAYDTANTLRDLLNEDNSFGIHAANRPAMILPISFPLLPSDPDQLNLKGAIVTILVADAPKLQALSQTLTGTNALSNLTEYGFRVIIGGKCQSVALATISKTA